MPTNKKVISYYPDNELREKLEKLCEKEERSLANVTLRLIRRGLYEYEKEEGIIN